MENLSEQMENKLKTIPIPSLEIRCYGRQIHIETKGRNTAEEWVSVLSEFSKIRGVIKTTKENKINKNTSLLPSQYTIYRVYSQI